MPTTPEQLVMLQMDLAQTTALADLSQRGLWMAVLMVLSFASLVGRRGRLIGFKEAL